mgnify:CR=1 FL=1
MANSWVNRQITSARLLNLLSDRADRLQASSSVTTQTLTIFCLKATTLT